MAIAQAHPSNSIEHKIDVDMVGRGIEDTVHIVQYDNTYPVICARLLNNGDTFYLDYQNIDAKLRFKKKDGKCMEIPVYGYGRAQSDYELYFQIPFQMTLYYGEYPAVIELSNGNTRACSSPIRIVIDKNPIQLDDLKSDSQVFEMIEYVRKCKEYYDSMSEVVKTSGNNLKNTLETTIIAKNGTVSKSGEVATCLELQNGILSIPDKIDMSDATVIQEHVLETDYFYNSNDIKLKGTMPKRGNTAWAVDAGFDFNNFNLWSTIQTGAYIEESLVGVFTSWISAEKIREIYGITPDKIVKGTSIAGVNGEAEGGGGTTIDTSATTTIASHVLAGDKFYDNSGVLTEGTMASYPVWTQAANGWYDIDNNNFAITIKKGAYLDGTDPEVSGVYLPIATVQAALGIDANKILAGQVIGGVAGNIPVSREWMQTTHWWLDPNNNNLCFNFKKGAYLLDDGRGYGCGWIDVPHIRDVYGITPDKILKGQTIAGVEGNIPVIPNGLQAPDGWIDAGNLNMGVHFPNGAYLEQDPWVWIPAYWIRAQYGITPDKIVTGQSICGVNGTGGGTGKYAHGSVEVTDSRREMLYSVKDRGVDGAGYSNNFLSVVKVNLGIDWTPKLVKTMFFYQEASNTQFYEFDSVLTSNNKIATMVKIIGSSKEQRIMIAENNNTFIDGNEIRVPTPFTTVDYAETKILHWEAWGN